jgi:uncharacterized repeat protein (TIGR03803 family)
MKTTNTKWYASVSLTKLSIVVTGMFLAATSSALAQPLITTQPTNHFMNASSPVAFSVAASGTGLNYQWLFNGRSLTGATSSTFALAAPQPTNWGYYSVIVSNASGSVTSQVAELKVFLAAAHSLSGIQVELDRSVSLNFAGETTALFAPYYDLYPLETSTNLIDWAPLATLQRSNTALDTLRFLDTNAPQFNRRFYRTPTNMLATPVPQPTGPYAVGTFSMLLTNVNRTNAIFMITVWYPAVAQAGFLPVKYEDPQAAVPANYGKFSSQATAFFSHSLSNASLATNLSLYPVVLYDPGATGDRRENTALTEELASWGYVVVSLDPADATISVFPDGTVVYGQTLPATIAGYVAAIEGRLLDMEFVLDELESLNASDPRFGGRLDLANIGAFGFSLGGCTTAQLCLRDPRCKAGVGMDAPYLETNVLTQPLDRPWLYFRSDLDPDPAAWFMALPGGVPDDRLQVYNAQETNAYWVKLASTVHGSFADWDLIVDSATLKAQFTTPMSGQFLAPVRVSEIRRAYLLSFFNKFLNGQDDHLLDGPSPAYPEVLQFLCKSGAAVPPEYPSAALVKGNDGNFYGTTEYGGASGMGTVFQATTNGTLTTLVSFNGINGSYPFAGLLQGSNGNFYGTTEYGGTDGNYGTVFEMTPSGALTMLVSFNGTNGSYPAAVLVQGSDGNFYGTTQSGGASGMGTVFQVTPVGVLTTLVSFNNTNGSVPLAGLVQGTNGNFYGTTFQGGDLSIDGIFNNSGAGTVFEMTPGGVLTTRVVFNGYNGANPAGGLVQGTNGNLYGTAAIGGNVSLNAGWGFGTAFKMTPGGTLTTLVSFGLTNGYNPTAGLVQGSDGNFYGTTDGGGAGGCGTVFQMTPAGVSTTLVSFKGANGNRPQAALVQGSDGNLYGTTEYGGANGLGTVFQVTPAGMLMTLVSF